ncbi:unnamed protein product [Cercospora beticola]|nr:unnamed protein product [Cercospora beticola]
MSTQETNIDLYTAGTPNGQKISITLEELGLKYNVHKIEIAKNQQKEEWFLKINRKSRLLRVHSKRAKEMASNGLSMDEDISMPSFLTVDDNGNTYPRGMLNGFNPDNSCPSKRSKPSSSLRFFRLNRNQLIAHSPPPANGRIPALIDTTNPSTPQTLFEGASIQLYLTSTYDPSHTLSFPPTSPEHYQLLNWLIWMQSGIGPMQGQANHFYRYAPTKIPYAITRYQTETKRLYQVLNDRLAEQEKKGEGLWIVGGKYTIADICCFSWVNWAEWAGVETKSFEALQRWLETIQKREAVKRGCDVPDKFEMKEAMKTKEGAEDYAKHHSNWVMKGVEEDQKKHA